jgi:hypothetical protein
MPDWYKITDHEPTTILLPGNRPADGIRVWFVLVGYNAVDYVEIQTVDFNAERTRELVEEKAAEILTLFTDE